jgi:hypothetical protein
MQRACSVCDSFNLQFQISGITVATPRFSLNIFTSIHWKSSTPVRYRPSTIMLLGISITPAMRVCSPIQFVLVLAASTASLVHAHPAGSADATGKAPGCRYIPSDRQWPSASDWSALNRTTGGKLIATVPMAHVCHSDNNGTYDEAACNALKAPTVFIDGVPS